jgi:hypothetical protein
MSEKSSRLSTEKRKDEQFNYGKYVEIETSLNKDKFERTSFSSEEVSAVVENFHRRPRPAGRQPFALCQGVRNGAEVRHFADHLKFRVLGTDISDSILGVPDGVMMDFHDCPKLWMGKVDFLYSNSWDQSYDVKACLAHWAGLLAEHGALYLQHTANHLKDSGYSLEGLKELVGSSGLECETVLAIGQPAGITVGLRRVRKFLARWMGRSLAMSRPFPGTQVLVAGKPRPKASQG